ncbi:restriction endonuclease subunit S [Hominiventricola aquisgranensis]|uniref:Restriction endonuclease subunit S n=1 Tax=Hominiventricola aquisgranensis TaxID=3133164 RepID=A0ABV1HX65_9FIRM
MRKMKDSGVEWIGEIPVDWKLSKIGSVYDERNEKVSDKDFAPLSVTKQGIVPQLETAAKTENGDNRKLIRKDDFVINSRSDRRGSCGISEYEGSCSLINTVLKPQTNMCNRYYGFVFKSDGFADEYYRWGHGIVDDLWSTKWIDMKSIYIPAPDITEQERIADYLNAKCSKIDEIIEKQQSIIEKLKEYKLSIIIETVTKGLNPNVEMKDSGVEWIGQMPTSWDCTTVGMIATVVRGASPRPAGDPLYFNGNDVPWITVAEVTKGDGKYIDETETFLTFEGAKQSRIVEEGTLLLSNSGATLGVPKITRIRGCINDGSVAFYNLSINQEFLLYLFKGRTFELRKQMQGYGQPNLNTTIVKGIEVPLPTELEQKAIVDFLDQKCTAIEKTIEDREKAIEKLQKYKKSLIYEVVTGKKEV